MITVLGATGNTGRAAIEHLLGAGLTVRAVARSKDKLEDLVKRGVDAYAGDLEDSAFLTRAFEGANAAYTLIPPHFAAPDFLAYADRVGESTVRALRAAGVPYVVFLSSIGADAERAGPVTALHRQERRLAELPNANVLSLRPGYFFENHHGALGMIKHMGINGGSIRADLPIPQLATRDIGSYAGRVLERLDFSGKGFRELHGPRPLSMAQATRILGARIGKPDLQYVQTSYEDALEAMVQAGLTRDMATLYTELSRGFNEGWLKAVDGPTAETTMATDFEVFAEGLAQAYAAM